MPIQHSTFIIPHSQSHHQCADEAQDSVEFGKSGIDQRVGEHVVTLGNADDTVGADLALADGGDQTDDTDAQADRIQGN